MGKNTNIEWCEHTFSPWWGCAKVSEGCKFCYAEKFSHRLGLKIWGQDAERRYFGDKHWSEPVKWNAAAKAAGLMHRVFCGSMCDILENRPGLEDPRLTVFEMAETLQDLLWLFLSKRPENAPAMYPDGWRRKWPRNVMAGFTIENQARLNERMPRIAEFHRQFPGARIFASCEPLLSALDWDHENKTWLEHFSWVIGGGESGAKARPCHPDWARKLRDDCVNRDDMCRPWPLPFLWKQWGEFLPDSQNPQLTDEGRRLSEGTAFAIRVGKKAAGRLLDGREWNEMPEVGR